MIQSPRHWLRLAFLFLGFLVVLSACIELTFENPNILYSRSDYRMVNQGADEEYLFMLGEGGEGDTDIDRKYDITVEDFCVFGCDFDAFEDDACFMDQLNDTWANANWVSDTTNISNDLVACYHLTLRNLGPHQVAITPSRPVTCFIYISPNDEFKAGEAILMGYLNLTNVTIPSGFDPVTEGKVDVHVTRDDGTVCLPYFYVDRFSYPESDPAGAGFYTYIQLDPGRVQLPKDTDRSNNTVRSSCKIHAINGGHDPIWSNADHNDLVWIETRSPRDNNTDTCVFFFDSGAAFSIGDPFHSDYYGAPCGNMEVQNLNDYQEFNACSAFVAASYYTPVFSDTIPSIPTPRNASFSKYLPAGDGEENWDDEYYYIRVQQSPFFPGANPDCYNLRACSLTNCDWGEDDDIPCGDSSSVVNTFLYDYDSIFSDPITGGTIRFKVDDPAIETRLDDTGDFDWYMLIRP